jgi:LysM repeat protein
MTAEPLPSPDDSPERAALARLWADITARGWRDAVLRFATHGLMLGVVTLAIWVSGWNLSTLDQLAAKASLDLTPVPPTAAVEAAPALPAALPNVSQWAPRDLPPGQITRKADPHTLIPTRGRQAVITYTVQAGDTLFGIAEKFSLKPETVLWGNYFTLKDDPHSLFPGQMLNILPVDGTYHYVTEGNTLEQIAKFYGVAAQEIVDWAGNGLDPERPALVPNSWLVIPGGHRESQAWTVPTIRREQTSSGNRANNFGQCPGGYTGAIGNGYFVWPTDNHTLSGYNYSAIHRGVDLRAPQGASVYAADGGVVVYAGWNDYGYGNLVVIDHGNGWQSVYAHLSQWNVSCGESVAQGQVVGLSGNTGRSSGAHLHFELRFNGAFVNPLDMLP